jgi:PKD domain
MRPLIRAGLVTLCVSAAGCDNLTPRVESLLARFDSDARVYVAADLCPAGILAVGERAQLVASVEAKDFGADYVSNLPVKHYDSTQRPDLFHWSLAFPTRHRQPARADITPTGIVAAADTGALYVHASSAGKTSHRFELEVVPRILRFSVSPRDTTVRRGDTLTLRMDLGLDGPSVPVREYRWNIPKMPVDTHLVTRVERDPWDQRDPFVPTPPPPEFEMRLVASYPGTLRFLPCAGGTRRDTVTIRITGDTVAPRRDVPPVVELSPAETTMYVGATFTNRFRIRNATLGNGPYRWRLSLGDGNVIVDSGGSSVRARSTFESEHALAVDHRYRTPGKFPVKLTVTDSAGRSTTVRTVYHVRLPVFQLMIHHPDTITVTRLRDGRRDLAIAILAEKVALVPGQLNLTSMSHEDVPPVRFGRTPLTRRRGGPSPFESLDANRDGHLDMVVYLDKETLIRNGDLRVGRNRLVMTGVLPRGRTRAPGSLVTTPLNVPVRGVVEFEVLP